MHSPSPASNHTKSARLIAVLALSSTFAPFATDMYLPAFAQMAAVFNTDHGSIEATLSTFFLGLAFGQALYGPIIDRFGRKLPLLFGVALFALATFGCLLTRDIEVFTALRFVQAIGGCAGMIIGRAIVHDLYGATESARVLSLMLMMMTMAPIVAPVLGGWIVTAAGWQAIFFFLLAFAALQATLVWKVVPETLPPERRNELDVASIVRAYSSLLRKPAFMVPALAGGIAQSSMFAFITGSPFIFMGHFGFSEQHYSWVFGLTAFGLMVGAQVNRMGLRRHRVTTMLSAALCVNLLAAAILVALADTEHARMFMLPLWFVIASLGLIGGNAAAVAMSASGQYAGTASALFGILQFSFAFTVSSAVAAAQNGTAYPMAIAMLSVSLLGTLLWFGGAPWREPRS
jgi:DHA1 family bicyclomycin/chloramphenicol resistance-like MFS transporter